MLGMLLTCDKCHKPIGYVKFNNQEETAKHTLCLECLEDILTDKFTDGNK